MLCCLSAIQGPLQAKLRPAVWLPGIRNLHSCNERASTNLIKDLQRPLSLKVFTQSHNLIKLYFDQRNLDSVLNWHEHAWQYNTDIERWEIKDLTPGVCVQKVVQAVARLAENEKIFLHKVNRETNVIQIFSYTKAEWLDIVEIEFRPGQYSGTEGFAKSFSTGLLPVWVPLSFFFNMVFFFVPFYDNQFNRKRLARIKEAMSDT